MAEREGETLIATERVYIESKLLYFDLKENQFGKFVKVSELHNRKRNTIVIPAGGISKFCEVIASLSEKAGSAAASGKKTAAKKAARARTPPPAAAAGGAAVIPSKLLNVFELPFATSSEELLAVFAAAGAASAEVLMRRDGTRSLGKGFVRFASEDAAAAALESMQGTEIGGRKIRIKFGRE